MFTTLQNYKIMEDLPDYKTIEVESKHTLGVILKTTYTIPKSSFFNLFSNKSKVQQYPVVYEIDENSEAYKKGLRIGHKIIKLNGYSLEYKDVKTIDLDFKYEKKSSDFLTLTIL